MQIQKLFAASSIQDHLGPYHNVKLNWLRYPENDDYNDYLSIDRDWRNRDFDESTKRSYVQRLFTQDEIDLLREYLQKHHQLALNVEEVELPLTVIPDLAREIQWKILKVEQWTGVRGELALSENDGEKYDLPFQVTYYWDANECDKDELVTVQCNQCTAYFGRVVIGTKLECARCGSQTEAVITEASTL